MINLSTLFADAAIITMFIAIMSLMTYMFYACIKAACTGRNSNGRRIRKDERIVCAFIAFVPVIFILLGLALITA